MPGRLMHRFFLPPDAFRGEQVHFPTDLARQITQVLRLRPGDRVVALDGVGHAFLVELKVVTKQQVGGKILSRQVATGEPSGDLILYPALSKGERFEWVLQKGVELGVTLFQPILTQRTLRRSPGAGRWARWRRIIREAAEQSGRGKLPPLRQPIAFEQALAQAPGMKLLPTVMAARPALEVLSQASWPVSLFIGPEGGFSPEEVAIAQSAAAIPVTLGPRVLRTETAAIVMVALSMAALGELNKPVSENAVFHMD